MADVPQKPESTAKKKAGPAKILLEKKVYRRFKATKASLVASGLLTVAIRAKGFIQAEVVTRWPQIVGPELALATVPQRMIFPRGERMGAKLVIRCESAFATLLEHKRERVIEMVNSFFGYGAVASIEIKQGPLPRARRVLMRQKKVLSKNDKNKLGSLVGEGELSPLQEAVKSLGEMVLSNQIIDLANPNDLMADSEDKNKAKGQ